MGKRNNSDQDIIGSQIKLIDTENYVTDTPFEERSTSAVQLETAQDLIEVSAEESSQEAVEVAERGDLIGANESADRSHTDSVDKL